MKRRFAGAAFLSGVVLSALSLNAQDLLPPQSLVPSPSVSVPAVPVSTADNYLNPLHQEEWVVLDAAGAVQGTFSQLTQEGTAKSIANATIHLTRNGALVKSTTTGADGKFAFDGIGVGAYGLTARSEGSIAAFALHVLPSGASNRLDSDFTVYGTSMGGPAIESVVRAHAVPPVASIAYPDLQSDPVGDARAFSDSSKVRLRNGGVLVGRVSKPAGFGTDDLSGNVVHLFRNGVVVAHQPTNGRGEFEVGNMTAGVYDIVVAGKDGVAVGSFQAVQPSGNAQVSKNAPRYVAAQQVTPDSLNVEMIPQTDYFTAEEEVIIPPTGGDVIPPAPAFVGPGGFPGGGFGGGGGGFGGGGGGGLGGLGGIGGLLGIGGLAAGVVALANDNNNNLNVPPASPVGP